MIKTALFYLAVGFALGAMILLEKAWQLNVHIWQLLPIHIEVVLFGFILQFAIGVAFWMLPRFATPPVRGNEKLAWGTFLLLNTGIVLVSSGQFYFQSNLYEFFGRVCELISVLLFILHTWPRIKPFAQAR